MGENGDPDPKHWKSSFRKLVEWLYPEQDTAKLPETVCDAMFLQNSAKLMEALCFNKHKKNLVPFKVLGPDSDVFECANGKRILYILSCLYNFASFREQFIEKFEALDAESTDLLSERMELEKETGELQERLEQLRRERAAEAPRVASLTAENAELARSIRSLNEQQVQVKARVEDLKLQIDITKNETEGVKETIKNLEEDIVILGQRIIDPEKIRDHLILQRSNIEREKSEIKQRSDAIRRIAQRVEALERIAVDVAKVKQQLVQIRSTIERERAQKSKASESRSSLNELTRQLEEQDAASQDAEKKLRQHQDDLDKKRASRADRIQKLHEELSVKTRFQKEAQAQAESTLKQIELNDRTRQDIEMKISAMKKDHHASFQVLQRNYDDLVSQVRRYHSALGSLMKEGIPSKS